MGFWKEKRIQKESEEEEVILGRMKGLDPLRV
jgi:hypothetical protein